jgi:sirohydrochlorin cobaltochelatase
MEQKIGVMICGHGSRDAGACTEFDALARGIRERMPDYEIESGYLEFARPIIREGLEKLKERGVNHILAVPGMLMAAGHAKNDIPSELNNFAAENPGITVEYGRELAIDPKLLRAARERIEEAEKAAGGDVSRADTMLMVVGRGASDSDANSNITKITRMLWEGMGFGWAETCYSGVAHPRVDEGLKMTSRLGFKRVIVFPYFLFTGILIQRIYDQTDAVAAEHPEIEFIKAPYLNDHPLVLDTFAERVREILTGDNNMNCAMCKYREQIIGYESDVGVPQVGHHHHVQGIGTDDDHHHHHHGHGHHHHHHHGHDHHHDHKPANGDAAE